MTPALRHPRRFVWDFWYYHDAATGLFHVFYLNADDALVPSGEHHDAAEVGYGVTTDFTTMEWGPCDVLKASPDRWDNMSIWTGDVIRIRDGFLMFYTSRNREEDDGQTQNIGIAFAPRIDTGEWKPVPGVRIRPDPRYYASRKIPGDLTTHAWRDPYLFRHDAHAYMLLTAKSLGQTVGKNGAVALLRSRNGDLTDWEILPPLATPGYYSEMEVSQIFRNGTSGYELVFSCADRFDFSPETRGEGGFLCIGSQTVSDFDQNSPRVLLPFSSGLYACRIIPELDGEIVGFDLKTGGLRRSGVRTGFTHTDRHFDGFVLK